MEKRNYPLFIIDSSRSHGRGEECDFLCCTDSTCPFIAVSELMLDDEYKRLYDKTDYCAIWSDQHNGIRTYIHVIGDKPTNKERTKSLLRRALKEMTIRRAPVSVDTDNVSDESVVKFADIVLQQTIERVRKEGGNATDKAVAAILLKIKKDYGKE
jgi:hypothetical protein